MAKLFCLYGGYTESSASSIRAVAFLKALSSLGVKATVVFFFPDKNKAKIKEDLPGLDVRYMWEDGYINHPIFKYVSYLKYWRKLKKEIQPGDSVYIYAYADALSRIINRKNVNVYFETTEHPVVHKPKSRIRIITIERYLTWCRRLKGLFVISSGLKRYYIEQGVEENKIKIINMTVDSKRFEGVVTTQKNRYIAYCGTIKNRIDGIDLLIKSFSLIAKKYPDVILKIAGRTSGVADVDTDKKLSVTLGLSERVQFVGALTPDEVPAFLSNATVLALHRPDCLQAIHGFPTKLGEYLLSGTPVVVTRVGDIGMYLTDKVNAFLVEPGNIEEFASKLDWVLSHPADATIVAKTGRDVALKEFDSVNEAQKIIEFMSL